jgi:hypothetical protein
MQAINLLFPVNLIEMPSPQRPVRRLLHCGISIWLVSAEGLGRVKTPGREQWTLCLSATVAIVEFYDFPGLEGALIERHGPLAAP